MTDNKDMFAGMLKDKTGNEKTDEEKLGELLALLVQLDCQGVRDRCKTANVPDESKKALMETLDTLEPLQAWAKKVVFKLLRAVVTDIEKTF